SSVILNFDLINSKNTKNILNQVITLIKMKKLSLLTFLIPKTYFNIKDLVEKCKYILNDIHSYQTSFEIELKDHNYFSNNPSLTIGFSQVEIAHLKKLIVRYNYNKTSITFNMIIN